MIPWNAFTTATKIRTARALFWLATLIRRIVGNQGPLVVTRRGIRFELDLAEGIDLSIFLLGAFEPDTVRALARLAPVGGTVLDIGANIGFHTLHLARAVGPYGRVFAFEPTDYAYAKLVRNLELNPDLASRVTPIQAYLDTDGDQETQSTFYSSWRLDGVADQHPKHFGTLESANHAVQLQLDRFVAENGIGDVDLIKIDVDGFECRILAGASKLLDDYGPTFVSELCPYALAEHGGSATEMLNVFTSRGYQFYNEKTFRVLQLDDSLLARLSARNSSMNMVAARRPGWNRNGTPA